jgi:hypothetical protein
MSSTEDNKPDNDVLTEKLEELESLLNDEEAIAEPQKIKIPILDELVTEADYINSEDDSDLEQVEAQITDLAEKLESKFSGEPDQLVRLLKDNLKNSIVEELRSQANLDSDESDMEKPLEIDSGDGLQNNKPEESGP